MAAWRPRSRRGRRGVGPVSVSGPAARMHERDLDALGAIVRAHVDGASRELGALPDELESLRDAMAGA